MLDEGLQDLLEVEDFRAIVNQRQHDHAEGALHLGVLVQIVEHDQRDFASLQFDHDPESVSIRFVPKIRNPLDPLVLDQIRDLFDQPCLVHLVGNLGHDDPIPLCPLVGLDHRLGSERQQAAAGPIGVLDALGAVDESGGGEIGARDLLHELVNGRVAVFEQQHQPVHDLGQVVSRDVRRVADGDSAGAVHQEIRYLGREDQRLDRGLVVVRAEIHGLLINVRQHFLGELRQACLGVAHGGRRIAVHRPVVALAVHQRIAHVEVLRHPDEGVVNRRVAMRMEVPHDLTDDLGGFTIGPVVDQAHLVHAVEDPTMDRLQPVTDVRQGSPDDHAHRVIQVGRPHLVFDGDLGQAFINRHPLSPRNG